MNRKEAIYFAGLMESYLNIPSFVCEMIEKKLIEGKYQEVIEYIIQRKKELDKGEDIKEIPQFEGTLEQLDKLSIRGKDNE